MLPALSLSLPLPGKRPTAAAAIMAAAAALVEGVGSCHPAILCSHLNSSSRGRSLCKSLSSMISTGSTLLAAALCLRLRHLPVILTATCKCPKFLSVFYIPCVPPSPTILYVLSQMFAFIFQKGLSSWLPMQTVARMHTMITSTAM